MDGTIAETRNYPGKGPVPMSPEAVEVRERCYYPGQQVGWGPRVWREMFQELSESRGLIWRLFIRDFSARYRQSALGVLWALILPVIAVATFVFLNRSGVLNVGDTGIPYVLYALLGITVWQVFATGITGCSNAIVNGGSMVVKINFAKESLVIASLGHSLVDLLVRVVLVAATMIVLGISPAWTVALVPLALLPLVLLTLGLGFFLALLNAVLRDVTHVVSVGVTFLMFLTPVVYPVPESGMLATVMKWNPLSGLIIAVRDLILRGGFTQPQDFLYSSVIAVLVFLLGWRVFHLVEPRMAERV